MSFWTRCEQFPPILVRLLARHKHGPPLTDREIAERSRIPVARVFTIGQSLTWEGIDIPTARAYLVACGFDFENREQYKRVEAYLRKRPVTWQFLRKSPLWKTYFEPLMLRYIRQRTTK